MKEVVGRMREVGGGRWEGGRRGCLLCLF